MNPAKASSNIRSQLQTVINTLSFGISSKMHFVHFFLISCMASCVCLGLARANYKGLRYGVDDVVVRNITVDQSGHGDFIRVQDAIDSIPLNNTGWIRINLLPDIYNEKVIIPQEKTFIALQGQNRETTVIQWNDSGNVSVSSTFTLLAENFVARDITFQNTYNLPPKYANGEKITWAPAALIQADKASFYGCGFISLQDTLTDFKGRHYFELCYIEGAIDFIWGGGQSIYKSCSINVTASRLGTTPGYIAAQGRNSSEDESGYVFIYGSVNGTGTTYLGRAYRGYSRVLFYQTNLAGIIVPQGWSAWHYNGSEGNISFAEVGCTGDGSHMSKRVSWEKQLDPKEVHQLTDVSTFIDQDGWLGKQPPM